MQVQPKQDRKRHCRPLMNCSLSNSPAACLTAPYLIPRTTRVSHCYGLGSTPCCLSHPLTFYHAALLVFLPSKLSLLDSLLLLSDLVRMLSSIGSPPKSSQAGEVPFPMHPGILCPPLSLPFHTTLGYLCPFSPLDSETLGEMCFLFVLPIMALNQQTLTK